MVPQRFENGIAVCIATGPSLSTAQVDIVRRAKALAYLDAVFGVNDSYRLAGDVLDYLYAADGRWVQHHLIETLALEAERWTCDDDYWKDSPGWRRIAVKSGEGMSVDRCHLIGGNHSGYQVINLAFLMGIRTVILLGYDAHSPGQHFFGRHPTPDMDIKSNYPAWMLNWRVLAERLDDYGLTIINCTPGSAIPFFPKRDLEEMIGDGLRERAG